MHVDVIDFTVSHKGTDHVYILACDYCDMTHIVSVLKSYKMRCYHLLFLVSFMPLVSSSGELFQSWKQHYGKHYRNIKEEQNRYAIWRRNLELVERHNKLNSSAFLMEMNRFADQVRLLNMYEYACV